MIKPEISFFFLGLIVVGHLCVVGATDSKATDK